MKKNSDKDKAGKQSFEDILYGEEPTEEFLEEFRALNESEEISDDELTKMALASKAESSDITDKPVEPNYKNNESNFLQVLITIVILSTAIYWLVDLLRS